MTGTGTGSTTGEHVLLTLLLMLIQVLLMMKMKIVMITSRCCWHHDCTRVCEALTGGAEPQSEARGVVGPGGGVGGAGATGELLHHGSEVGGVSVE